MNIVVSENGKCNGMSIVVVVNNVMCASPTLYSVVGVWSCGKNAMDMDLILTKVKVIFFLYIFNPR